LLYNERASIAYALRTDLVRLAEVSMSRRTGFILNMSFKITLEDVNILLNCPELERVQLRILERRQIAIVPTSSAMPMFREASLTGLTIEDYLHVLRFCADGLVEFGKKILELEEQDIEENPNEAASEEDNGDMEPPRLVGFANGFGSTYAAYYLFLNAKKDSEFLDFSKNVV
jgi:hypothetical protein